MTETNAAFVSSIISIKNLSSDFLSLSCKGKISLCSQLSLELSILWPQHPKCGVDPLTLDLSSITCSVGPKGCGYVFIMLLPRSGNFLSAMGDGGNNNNQKG